MVNIALTNHNSLSSDRTVIINIATGMCTFADNREIKLKHLINGQDFCHPLLVEPFTPAPEHVFHYEYDDIDGLFYSAIYVYSVLLHTDDPLACKFKINPSLLFQPSNITDKVYFSFKSHQLAQESIHIWQLEKLVTELGGYPFEFSDDFVIDDEFTIEDLPHTIDGDALYHSDLNLVELLKQPRDLSYYELRYINPTVGFGVFSRDVIKQGDFVSFYSGVKTIHKHITVEYAYLKKLDTLGMQLDAREHGNITRFINHAPNSDTNEVSLHNALLLEANIKPLSYYLNGIQIVAYSASKDILKGEQLLADYGKLFFQNVPVSRFKSNGQLIEPNKKMHFNSSRKKLNQIKIMANVGIRDAQRYMNLRMLGVIGVILLFMGILNNL